MTRSSPRRRAILWTLAFLFALLCLWWCTFFRYDANRIYRAIPLNAALVSRHVNLGARWKEALGNPAVRAVARLCGADDKTLHDLATDRGTDRLLGLLASRETVFGYVPFLQGTGRDAWVVGSWIGSQGKLIQWGVYKKLLKDFRIARGEGGRKLWTAPLGNGPSPLYFSATVVEGVLVGCLSRDPLAVDRVAARVDFGGTVIPALAKAARDAACPADWAWTRWIDREMARAYDLQLAFTQLNAAGCRGWARGNVPLIPGVSAAAMAEVGALAGEAPEAVALAPLAEVDPARWTRMPSKALASAYARLQSQSTKGAPVFACLLGGDYGGRVVGLRTPAVLLGVKIRDRKLALDQLAQQVDELNAQYGWTVILRHVDNPPPDTVEAVFETTDGGYYSGLAPRERPAVGFAGDWLLLCSNLNTLEKILVEHGATGAAPAAGNGALPRWVSTLSARLPAGANAGAAAWFDLDRMEPSVRTVVAVWTLALLARDSSAVAETRTRLQQVNELFGMLRPLRTLSLSFRPEDEGFQVDFQAGGAGSVP